MEQEWNSNYPSELAKLPTLEAQCEDNIKSDAGDLWKLYSKENPGGAKTITNAIEDVEIAKNELEGAWELYKKEDPVHAGEAAGAWNFVKDTVGGVLGLAHGAGVQYYDLRENPIQTLKNWARFGMDVEGLVNPLMPETADDKIIISSIGKEIDKDLIHGDAYTRSKFGTEAILNIATLWDGAGEVSAAGKVGEASSDLSKVVEVSTKVEDASKGISEVSAAEKTVEELQVANKATDLGKESQAALVNEEDKIGLDSKALESINTPSQGEAAMNATITPKPEEVLVGSAAVNESKVESAVNALDKTGEDIKIKDVDEAEVNSGKGDIKGVSEAVEGNSRSTIEKLTNNDIKVIIEKHGYNVDDFSKLLQYDKNLNSEEQAVVDNIRDEIGLPTDGTIMNKTVPQRDIYNYLYGNYKSVGGFVSVDEHSSNLKGLESICEGNRLDYDGTLFKPYDGVSGIGVNERSTINMDAYTVKDSVYGKITYTYNDGTTIKVPKGGATPENAPFSGKGFTASKNIVLPECEQGYQLLEEGDIFSVCDAKTGEVIQKYIYEQNVDGTKGWQLIN